MYIYIVYRTRIELDYRSLSSITATVLRISSIALVLCFYYLPALSGHEHDGLFFCFLFSSGGWVKIWVKLPHFHVSDTCRAVCQFNPTLPLQQQ